MPRTLKTTIYKFNELSDAAKEHAREWYREGGFDYEWWDFTYDTIKDAGRILGIAIEDIYFSGFYSQGDGACFTGNYEYKPGSAKAIREEFPTQTDLHELADSLQALQRKWFYGLSARVSHSGRYYHEYCTHINVESNDEITGYDRSILEAEEEELSDLLRDFMRWSYWMLKQEYEWLTSDEAVEDTIIANEYEFTEDGQFAR